MAQAAHELGVSAMTVARWCESGKLLAIPKPYGKKTTWQISPQAVEFFKTHQGQREVQDAILKNPAKPHNEYISAWVKAMTKGTLGGKVFSNRTIDDYKRYVDLYLARHQSLTVEGLKAELMQIAPQSFSKRHHCYHALVSFGKFLIQHGAFDADFLDSVKCLKPKRHLPPKRTVVSADGLDSLIKACESAQDRLIVTLLSQTGLRASEACALRWEDIDTENAVLTVRLGKGNKTRRVGLPAISMAALQKHLETCSGIKAGSAVLLNDLGKPMTRYGLYQRLERIGKKAGVKVTPHALRRAFVTINAAKGRPLPMLQQACGHSDVRTTMGYCQIAEKELIEAMKTWC